MEKFDIQKVASIKQAAVTLYNVNKSTVDYDEKSILDVINRAIAFLNVTLNKVERERVIKDVMMQCQIRHSYEGSMITDDYFHKQWYSERDKGEEFFWNRYKNYLINEKHFGLNIVNKLEQETLEDLLNYLGDPKSLSSFLRRGLVIGDVQSGKTSTYTGLICKAADAGYKVIILLTGTIESLRKQTQERIEEGFVGANIAKLEDGISAEFRVGVGKDGKPIMVTALTSRENDFVGNTNKILTSIESNKVVLFVIKKNTTVLKKLIEWLKEINGDPTDKKIHYPMLLIDDEADNASINTKKEDENPTAVNRSIRQLVDLFTQSNYVGFTATPFANIFINPKTTDEMENADLFPENFIYCLPTPSNYIGARRIFCDDGDKLNSLVYITDAGMIEDDGYSFYCTHKKEWKGQLPNSLTEAIYAFLLANAVRDLRNDTTTHRSMLINMSRFVKVQQYIKGQVEDIFDKVVREIKFNISENVEDFKNNEILCKLYKVWQDQFENQIEFTWTDICSTLFNSISSILIKVVNSSRDSEKIDYNKNKEKGLRLIAIGGLALSRGLTLEGLIVSYFFRNTATYDVLMQMGRWFGYRDNYDDLFRIWIGAKSASWYAEISNATEELKKDMETMKELHRTPKDFGIRVRNDSQELGITASNKMRTAVSRIIYEAYFGKIVQCPYLLNEVQANTYNQTLISNLIQRAIKDGAKKYQEGYKYLIKDVKKEIIIELFSKIKLFNFGKFDTKDIHEFLMNYNDELLDKWDIAIMSGSGDKSTFSNLSVKFIERTCEFGKNKISVSSRGQLMGPNDSAIGLDEENKHKAEKAFYDDYKKINGKSFDKNKNIPAKVYFEYLDPKFKRNPLIVVYLIQISKDSKTDQNRDGKLDANTINNFTPLVSLAMGIPKSKYNISKISKYKVNRIYAEEESEE